MRTNLFGHYLVWCLLLVSGCTLMQESQLLKSEKPKMNIDGIVAKIRTIDTGQTTKKNMKGVGVIIEIEEYYNFHKEEDIYKILSNDVMALLQSKGISAYLLYDVNDPRIENIGIILHIIYSEGEHVVSTGSNVYQEFQHMQFLTENAASFGNVGNAFAYAAMTQPQSITLLKRFDVINIVNIITGKCFSTSGNDIYKAGSFPNIYYDAIRSLKEQIEVNSTDSLSEQK